MLIIAYHGVRTVQQCIRIRILTLPDSMSTWVHGSTNYVNKSQCVCSPSHLLSLINHVTYSVLFVPIRNYIVFAVVKHMVSRGVYVLHLQLHNAVQERPRR